MNNIKKIIICCCYSFDNYSLENEIKINNFMGTNTREALCEHGYSIL